MSDDYNDYHCHRCGCVVIRLVKGKVRHNTQFTCEKCAGGENIFDDLFSTLKRR